MTLANAEYLASIAKQYAVEAANIRGRTGALAVVGKQFFGGWNSYQTHPLMTTYGKNEFAIHLHAEVAAMIKAKWKAQALIVVRVMADGSLGLARPCDGCRRALVNVPEIWFSTEGGLCKL